MQNRPPSFDEATIIAVKTTSHLDYNTAFIVIHNILGEEIERSIHPNGLMNEVLYTHGYGKVGNYSNTLEIDCEPKVTKMVVFANSSEKTD